MQRREVFKSLRDDLFIIQEQLNAKVSDVFRIDFPEFAADLDRVIGECNDTLEIAQFDPKTEAETTDKLENFVNRIGAMKRLLKSNEMESINTLPALEALKKIENTLLTRYDIEPHRDGDAIETFLR